MRSSCFCSFACIWCFDEERGTDGGNNADRYGKGSSGFPAVEGSYGMPLSSEGVVWLWIKSCTSLYYSIEHTTRQKPMKLTFLGGD